MPKQSKSKDVVAPNSGGGEDDLGYCTYLQGESAEEGGAERKKEDINCFNSTNNFKEIAC